MSHERRQNRRFSVVNLPLIDFESDTVIGRVVNISMGGLLLLTDIQFDLGDSRYFKITFHPAAGELIDYRFLGDVVWITGELKEKETYAVGLQFAENEDKQFEFLRNLINLYHSSES